jgi:RHS repeat-associated protein
MGVYCVTSSADGFFQVITASEENVYYGGRLVAKRTGVHTAFSNGQVGDFTMDRLHSKGDGSKFYPYGESRTSAAGDDKEQFATYTRDQGTGLDYADQRWYASGLGRFTSVDPWVNLESGSGYRSGYEYAFGDPENASDPTGLRGAWCGTPWQSAQDGSCDYGEGSGSEGCGMTRIGCIPGGGGGAGGVLVPCIELDPLSSSYGAVTFCSAGLFGYGFAPQQNLSDMRYGTNGETTRFYIVPPFLDRFPVLLSRPWEQLFLGSSLDSVIENCKKWARDVYALNQHTIRSHSDQIRRITTSVHSAIFAAALGQIVRANILSPNRGIALAMTAYFTAKVALNAELAKIAAEEYSKLAEAASILNSTLASCERNAN